MKKFLFVFIIFCNVINVTAQNLNYYLPDSLTYNPAIPKPKEVIFHEVGEWHVTHDRLVNYMKAMAAANPARIKLETTGFTYEQRPQLLLIITSPKNHQRLEQIRLEHLSLTDPSKSASLITAQMPIVVWIGNSIHGNEPSGANAGLLLAYYLAAAEGKQIDDLLENTVILFDPSFNPDGLQRFSTWANQHKGKTQVSDPDSREFNEVWPGGRFNHYWFDLNRDWLPAVHPESRNRLKWFHLWKPNILTDHHEQGSNATFFFQPGVPSRVNPLTPAKNQELTVKLGKFHAAFLNRIGSLYFTKENYDDFYYGKGSTYPDIQGCIGILFEQASSRGHAQETANGLLTFPATIKNQFTTMLSTLEGANALRKEFLDYQRSFFQNAVSPGRTAVYVYGDKKDPARTSLFTEMLQRHGIEIYRTQGEVKTGGLFFDQDYSFIVPEQQAQSTLVRTIFEKNFSYADSLFYDITSWTMPLAFGLPYAVATTATAPLGSKLGNEVLAKKRLQGGKSQYAYLMEWDQYYAPAALNELMQSGVAVKAAMGGFEISVNGGMKKFDPGTLMIPVLRQKQDPETLMILLDALAEKYRLNIYATATGGSVSGIDLGSSKFSALTKPRMAIMVGAGVNATDAGEIWHLLDQRMGMPATQLEASVFNRTDLSKYNTLIFPGGRYSEVNKDKLKTWVQNGGNLILLEEAIAWAVQNGISSVTMKKVKNPADSTMRLPYSSREQVEGAQQMSGAIFGADVDLTHPLAFGYHSPVVSLFKANKVYMEKGKNPYSTPFYYNNQPLQSGWISRENGDAVKQSAAVVVTALDNGRIIHIADNPNFRGFWLGGTKLMMNAIFFGKSIELSSQQREE
jgi:hypothetical protein